MQRSNPQVPSDATLLGVSTSLVQLKSQYDFIVCGSGSSGTVVARWLEKNPAVKVLLLEAGGTDDVAEVLDPACWLENLKSERVWDYAAEPNASLGGRSCRSPWARCSA